MSNPLFRWFTQPHSPELDPLNFRNVQIDAVGVGLASAAAPFLPVFLTRLGASTLQVSLLTTMPAITGLLLAIPLGQFLQSRKNIIPWFSFARLTVLMGYTLTGILTLFLNPSYSIYSILGIWALATIPQTILSITFSVVMNAVAGPAGRYELMTHRWSILGLTTSIAVILSGQVLDRLPFPFNYQVVFIALSTGGLVSYFFSSRIHLQSTMKTISTRGTPILEQLREYFHLISNERPFVNFIAHRFVFMIGTTLAATLLPIYFVRTLQAPDSWIANINTAQTVILILGYFLWTYESRKHGSRLVLLATTFGVSLYPILTGMTNVIWPVMFYAGLSGVFQAGLNLVFFDELMRRVPPEYSATFIAIAQCFQYMSSIIAPMIATLLSGMIGLGATLIISGGISILGFALFATEHLTVAEVKSSPS